MHLGIILCWLHVLFTLALPFLVQMNVALTLQSTLTFTLAHTLTWTCSYTYRCINTDAHTPALAPLPTPTSTSNSTNSTLTSLSIFQFPSYIWTRKTCWPHFERPKQSWSTPFHLHATPRSHGEQRVQLSDHINDTWISMLFLWMRFATVIRSLYFSFVKYSAWCGFRHGCFWWLCRSCHQLVTPFQNRKASRSLSQMKLVWCSLERVCAKRTQVPVVHGSVHMFLQSQSFLVPTSPCVRFCGVRLDACADDSRNCT